MLENSLDILELGNVRNFFITSYNSNYLGMGTCNIFEKNSVNCFSPEFKKVNMSNPLRNPSMNYSSMNESGVLFKWLNYVNKSEN